MRRIGPAYASQLGLNLQVVVSIFIRWWAQQVRHGREAAGTLQ